MIKKVNKEKKVPRIRKKGEGKSREAIERQKRAAKNILRGMPKYQALIEAGYSPTYVERDGYKLLKRPCIQSIFTDSCQRIMSKSDMQFDEIMQPIFDALGAKVIVRSTQLGDAREVDLPDYSTRMSAADRLIELFGGTGKTSDVQPPPSNDAPRFDTTSWTDEDWAMFRKLREKSTQRVVNA